MQRIGFKMKLKPGCKEEYKRRHKEIWPAIVALLKESGISKYSIFLDSENDNLFAIQTMDGTQSSQGLQNYEIIREWWKYMEDIMETNADGSPVSVPLEEMFYMD